MVGTPATPKRQKIINYRFASYILLLVILGMLAAWRPWDNPKSDRSITVSGEAAITAEPDEFVFYPTYSLNTKAELDTKSSDVVTGLKKLGVADSKIETSANKQDYRILIAPEPGGSGTYSLRLAVTIGDMRLAQKVQDYLATTGASGAITPHAAFSANKQHNLEAKARQQASKDARNKADQSAKDLGFRVGAVKTVDDSGFDDGVQPFAIEKEANSQTATDDTKLTIQPGEDSLTYTIEVTYYIK